MSPEQAQQHDVDERSDQYSLATVLYELLCGALPVAVEPGKSLQTAQAIVAQPPEPPYRHNPALPADLSVILLKALSKDPLERYASVRAFADDLQRVLNGEAIVARVEPSWATLLRKARRLSAARPAAVLGATTAIALAAGYPAGIALNQLGLDSWIEKTATTRLNHVPDAPLPGVRLIAITERTVATMHPELSEQAEADPQTSRRLLRLLHGQVAARLAAGKPKVVVFDIRFRPTANATAVDTQADQALAAGVRSLVDAGVPCVVARFPFDAGSTAEPWVIPPLQPLVTSGFPFGVTTPDAAWYVYTAIQRRGIAPLPGLTMAAFTACSGLPAGESTLDVDLAEVRVVHNNRPHATPTSFVSDSMPTVDASGLQSDDLVAGVLLEVPRTADLDAVRWPMESVLQMHDAELSRHFGGKAVLIGDYRPNRDGPFTHPDGRQFNGTDANAIALQSLIDRRLPRRLGYLSLGASRVHLSFLFLTAAGVAGAALGRIAAGRTIAPAVAVCAIGPAALLIIGYQIFGRVWSPAACTIAALTGLLISAFLRPTAPSRRVRGSIERRSSL
jgi:hypothetical protein